MGHHISGFIMNTAYSDNIAQAFDLRPISLHRMITFFPLNHYYTEYWSLLLKQPLERLPGAPPKNPCFPNDEILIEIISLLTAQENPIFAVIETDYFGGLGHQWARLYHGHQWIHQEYEQINDVLRFFGVGRTSKMDEFDQVGLGKIRSNPSYLEDYGDYVEKLYEHLDLKKKEAEQQYKNTLEDILLSSEKS